MPTFQITELRTVLATFLVDAETVDEAEHKFLAGDSGQVLKVDEEILDSNSLTVEPFDTSASSAPGA